MTRFLQALAVGIGNGSAYALLALGFVIIYKATRVISFAHPAIMVVGAAWVSFLAVSWGWNFYLAVVAAALITALIAMAVERAALRPLVGKPVFIAAIVTLAIDVMLRTLVNRFIGVQLRPMGAPWGFNTADLGGVFVQHRHIAMVVTGAVAVAALFAFFKYSRIGLGMRAASFDQEVALAQGISVGKVFSLSWGIAGALAAIAGMFVHTETGMTQFTWVVALKALPAIILGGLDSIGGAVVGGLAVGVFEALFATYQPQLAPWLGDNFSVVSPYLLMLLVLMIKPYGLWGTPEIERV